MRLAITAATLVSKVSLLATGKLPTFTTGSVKWLKIIAIANIFIDEWASERGVNWNSLALPDTVVTTVTATDTFALPATVRVISQAPDDYVRITHTNGTSYTNYKTIPLSKLKYFDYGYYVTQQGRNLKFNRAFKTTDPQFGGTIKVPAYGYAPNIAADTDVVPVDDPNWLVFVTAAEYIRNDITRQNQYPNLINLANERMQGMKEENDTQDSTIIRDWNPTGTMPFGHTSYRSDYL